MWTTIACRYFFCTGQTEEDANELFKKRYCSNRTLQNLARNNISIDHFRRLLHRLALMLPDLEHSTPHWTTDQPAQLLVVIGRAHLQWRRVPGRSDKYKPLPVIRQPRFGLCALEGRIHIWTDAKWGTDADNNNPPYSLFQPEQWLPWPGREGKCYFTSPLFAEQPENFESPHPLADGEPLWCFLQEVMSSVGSPDFTLLAAFQGIRSSFNVPEECDVIYPKLIDKCKKGDEDQGLQSSKTKASQPSQTPIPPNINNATVCAPHISEMETDSHTESNLEIVAEKCLNELQLPFAEKVYLSDAPNTTGRYYVYVLLDPRTNIPFYVGKGVFDRALQHFRQLTENDQTDPIVETEDTNDLKVGVTSNEIWCAEGLQDVDQNPESAKLQKIRELINSGILIEEIPRVIARGLSNQAAFSIEALLIKGVYGLQTLTNEVQGKHHERFRAVNDWNYTDGFDLPATRDGDLIADTNQHPCGYFYVYVLRDPGSGEIFYVGKGQSSRLCQHFADAQANVPIDDIQRLARLREFLAKYRPQDIGRIVARVDSAALAYVVESFYMKFVVGFKQLLNIQPGHLYGMFRSFGDWELRHGFDLPTRIQGGMRAMLKDIFLGEGLDDALAAVVMHQALSNILCNQKGPKLIGAGELAYLCKIHGVPAEVVLRVQIRCARRIQVALYPIGIKGRKWIRKHFGRLGLYPLHREDDMFIPHCWKGAANVAVEQDDAIRRAIRLANLAQKLQTSNNIQDLENFNDLLNGLPRS